MSTEELKDTSLFMLFFWSLQQILQILKRQQLHDRQEKHYHTAGSESLIAL